jgi:hypothetical protein
MKKQQQPYTQVVLRNRFNNETTNGTLVGEKDIDGKMFYMVLLNGRPVAFAKDAHALTRS